MRSKQARQTKALAPRVRETVVRNAKLVSRRRSPRAFACRRIGKEKRPRGWVQGARPAAGRRHVLRTAWMEVLCSADVGARCGPRRDVADAAHFRPISRRIRSRGMAALTRRRWRVVDHRTGGSHRLRPRRREFSLEVGRGRGRALWVSGRVTREPTRERREGRVINTMRGELNRASERALLRAALYTCDKKQHNRTGQQRNARSRASSTTRRAFRRIAASIPRRARRGGRRRCPR